MEYQNNTGQGIAYAQLQELGGSDYEIVDGEPDIRGWEVKSGVNEKVGEVDELLFDPQALKVRYLVVDTKTDGAGNGDKRKVLIPIGVAQLNTGDKEVLMPGLASEQINNLSGYEGWDKMTAEVESNNRQVFEPGYNDDYSYPGFYENDHFNEDRFYNGGTDDTSGDNNQQRFREKNKNASASETASTLNDLVAILNDRIEGYTRAKHELDGKESDLNELCLELIDESRTLRMELGQEVTALSKDTETDSTTRGKIYRAWMDVKAAFTGSDRHAVLAACEYGEDAAQKAYKSALAEEGLPANIRSMIENQKQTLKASHDKVKALRDASAS